MAVCGLKCVDLCKDTTRITGVHFSYEKNFLEKTTKIQNVLKVWSIRSFTVEGKIVFFKSFAISKIVSLSVMVKVPTEIIVELQKIQKRFIWPTKPKFKNETISSDFKDGVLKM